MDLVQIKRVAIGAAYKGAEIIRQFYEKMPKIDKKGAIDLVTEADIGSEEAIIGAIQRRYPDHGIWAEESGRHQCTSDYQWIIDPLDGTTNFAHRLGIFAVSIAFAWKGDVVAGVVLNPVDGELFAATADEGSQLNGRPVRVSRATRVSESLLVTGFPYDFHADLEELTVRFADCLRAAQGVRRLGSAALDLCYVACGRFDGFWEQNLHPWDTAAGMLINRQAGGVVTDFRSIPFTVDRKEILATNGRIHRELLSILQPKVP